MTSNKPVVLQLLSSVLLGGQENLLLSLLEASVNTQQVDFVVVVMNTDIDPIQYEKLMALNIPLYFLNRKQGHIHPKYFISLLKIIRKHRVQIIHTHDFGAKFWSVLCKFFAWNLKLVFTMHNTLPVFRCPQVNQWISRHWVDMNISVSDSVEAILAKDDISNQQLIPNGINLKKFAQLPKSSFAPTLKLINVARMVPEIKGQDILIEALHLCQQNNIPFHCTFVGEILPAFQPEFERLQSKAEQYGLLSCVDFHGPSAEVPALLKKQDLFILPSRKEAFGLAIIEAMASGIPVIASSTEGPAEIITDQYNGLLFETENAISLFEKIRFAYFNQAAMRQIAEQAYQDVKQYGIEQTLNLHENFYKKLIIPTSRALIIELKSGSKKLLHATTY